MIRPSLIVDALALLLFLALVASLVCIAGCGSSRDSQTKTVEKLTTRTGPLVLDTPIGQFVAQPLTHEMVRSETEVSTEQSRIDAPEIGAIASAAAGGTPFGALAGILGGVLAAGAGAKALQLKRHRDELVDGIERGSKDMADDEWAKLRAGLEAEQSADTKRAVKARVG
jgi:hypothetical protein